MKNKYTKSVKEKGLNEVWTNIHTGKKVLIVGREIVAVSREHKLNILIEEDGQRWEEGFFLAHHK